MMSERSHRDIEALLGAYALDAVDADEAEAIELHLRDCPRCRSEVAEHRETASFLSHSGQPAPEGGWDRLVASLDEQPPELDMSRFAPDPGRGLGSGRTGGATIIAPARWRRVALAATAAAAAVALLAGVTVVRLNNRLDDVKQQVALASGIRDQALAAAGDPARREIRLASTQGQPAATGVLLPDGRLYLFDDHLQPLTADRTYQLWGVFPDKRVVSLGLLGSDPDVALFRGDPALVALAITEERAGGVVSSTNQPTASGPVTA